MKNKLMLSILFTAGIFYSFFLFGFIDSIKGPVMPSLISDLKLSYSQAGFLIFLSFAGFLTATIISGITSDRFGKKTSLLITSSIILCGCILVSAAQNYITGSLAFLLIGYGLGSLELMGNAVIIDLYKTDRARMLNYLTFFYSAGAIISPVYAGLILNKGFIWKNVYSITIAMSIVLVIFLLLVKYPKPHIVHSHSAIKSNLKTSFSRTLIYIYIAMTFYMAGEVGLITWLVEYLIKVKGVNIVLGSLMLSIFFVCLGAGRIIGSFFVERTGYLKLMIICAILSILCLTFGFFLDKRFIFLFSLTGLFFSIMFPTLTAFFSMENPGESNTKFGILFTFSGLGGLIGPWAVGTLGQFFTIQKSLILIVFFCIIILIALFKLRKTNS